MEDVIGGVLFKMLMLSMYIAGLMAIWTVIVALGLYIHHMIFVW